MFQRILLDKAWKIAWSRALGGSSTRSCDTFWKSLGFMRALCGGKVIWCEPLRHLSFARTFWLAHQPYLRGKAVPCGAWSFHSNECELLRGLPRTASQDLEVTSCQNVHAAWEGLLGAVNTSSLDSLNAKELEELMDKVLQIHSCLGHPSSV